MAKYIDDLFAVNSARLRALGVITPDASTAVVSFGEGEHALRREIGVWHRFWSHGRGLSLFLCPACGGKAQFLRVHDGSPKCRKCLERLGMRYRSAYGTAAEKVAARVVRIEKLKAKLAAPTLRLKPLPGRTIQRPVALEVSLRRALILAQRDSRR